MLALTSRAQLPIGVATGPSVSHTHSHTLSQLLAELCQQLLRQVRHLCQQESRQSPHLWETLQVLNTPSLLRHHRVLMCMQARAFCLGTSLQMVMCCEASEHMSIAQVMNSIWKLDLGMNVISSKCIRIACHVSGWLVNRLHCGKMEMVL
jgi:hypothetical protein